MQGSTSRADPRTDPGTNPGTRTRTSGLLTPGPRFLAIDLLALPPAVVAFSSEGATQKVSALIAIGWFALVPLGLYARRAVTALPIMALAALAAALAVVPFNSAPFWANICTTAAMFLATLPRQAAAPARRELARLS